MTLNVFLKIILAFLTTRQGYLRSLPGNLAARFPKIVAVMSLGPAGASLEPEQAENFEDVSRCLIGSLARLC